MSLHFVDAVIDGVLATGVGAAVLLTNAATALAIAAGYRTGNAIVRCHIRACIRRLERHANHPANHRHQPREEEL
ncbi:hypothetical protein AB0N14_13750 [Streptomyces sp. NPDC051104]|uniref:hypothetical protein n=1 Tax=Streptomyces sp. NPDC051104 TaxID=3155044 RepID=UPI003413B2B8